MNTYSIWASFPAPRKLSCTRIYKIHIGCFDTLYGHVTKKAMLCFPGSKRHVTFSSSRVHVQKKASCRRELQGCFLPAGVDYSNWHLARPPSTTYEIPASSSAVR